MIACGHYRFCIPHVTSDKLFGKDVTAFGTDVQENEMNEILGVLGSRHYWFYITHVSSKTLFFMG